MHLKNLLKYHKISIIIFLLIILIGCERHFYSALSFNPLPLSTGQWVEYVIDTIPYEKYHVKFSVLDINERGILLETDYFSQEDTLKIISFNNIENNYTIDTFIVQYNSSKAYKFITTNGYFIFSSPIEQLFKWAEKIDTLNWKTIIYNNKQFNVFPVIINRDTILYSPEIPVFNVAKMFVNNENLIVYNYGNKGAKRLIPKNTEIMIMGEQLPEQIKQLLNP